MQIKKYITADGMVGYDEFGQLVLTREVRMGSDVCMVSTFIADVRDKICMICDQEWELNGDSMGDQHHWSLIDEFVHETCLARHHGLIERAEYHYAFVEAGVRFHVLKPIPNRYWGPPTAHVLGNKPWYETTLCDHSIRFTIGPRKRVHEIIIESIDGSILSWERAAEQDFRTENVTKEFGSNKILIHAWGFDKMREYIKRIVLVGGLAAARDGGVV